MYICSMEKEFLYPAFPIMHVGIGDGYVDYLLSGVLATHGYVIRDIRREGSDMLVMCDKRTDKDSGRYILRINPFCSASVEFPEILHWNELRLRYALSEGVLGEPVWAVAISYGNGLPGSERICVMDLLCDDIICK